MIPKLPGMERSQDIRQQDIQRIIREKLEGFKVRQRGREQVRAAKRKVKVLVTSEQKGLFE